MYLFPQCSQSLGWKTMNHFAPASALATALIHNVERPPERRRLGTALPRRRATRLTTSVRASRRVRRASRTSATGVAAELCMVVPFRRMPALVRFCHSTGVTGHGPQSAIFDQLKGPPLFWGRHGQLPTATGSSYVRAAAQRRGHTIENEPRTKRLYTSRYSAERNGPTGNISVTGAGRYTNQKLVKRILGHVDFRTFSWGIASPKNPRKKLVAFPSRPGLSQVTVVPGLGSGGGPVARN